MSARAVAEVTSFDIATTISSATLTAFTPAGPVIQLVDLLSISSSDTASVCTRRPWIMLIAALRHVDLPPALRPLEQPSDTDHERLGDEVQATSSIPPRVEGERLALATSVVLAVVESKVLPPHSGYRNACPADGGWPTLRCCRQCIDLDKSSAPAPSSSGGR